MNRRELLRGCGVVVLGGVAAKLGAEATPAYQWKKLGVMVRADDVMEPDSFNAMAEAADPARVLTRHDAMKQIERAEFRVLLRGEGRMM